MQISLNFDALMMMGDDEEGNKEEKMKKKIKINARVAVPSSLHDDKTFHTHFNKLYPSFSIIEQHRLRCNEIKFLCMHHFFVSSQKKERF